MTLTRSSKFVNDCRSCSNVDDIRVFTLEQILFWWQFFIMEWFHYDDFALHLVLKKVDATCNGNTCYSLRFKIFQLKIV